MVDGQVSSLLNTLILCLSYTETKLRWSQPILLINDYEEDYGNDESVEVKEGEDFEATIVDFSSEDIFTNCVLSLGPIIDYDVGHEQDNEDLLEELLRNGLHVFNYNFGSLEEVNAAMNQLIEANFFTSQHDNARRSLSISTYGSSLHLPFNGRRWAPPPNDWLLVHLVMELIDVALSVSY